MLTKEGFKRLFKPINGSWVAIIPDIGRMYISMCYRDGVEIFYSSSETESGMFENSDDLIKVMYNLYKLKIMEKNQ